MHSCILDGEMMGWNPAKNDFVAKRENIDIKSKNPSDDISLDMNRCFVVFDLVYLNGENICHRPLSERLELLHTVFTPVPGYFIMSKHIVGRFIMSMLIFYSYSTAN